MGTEVKEDSPRRLQGSTTIGGTRLNLHFCSTRIAAMATCAIHKVLSASVMWGVVEEADVEPECVTAVQVSLTLTWAGTPEPQYAKSPGGKLAFLWTTVNGRSRPPWILGHVHSIVNV
jgi:hypothetical protein